MARDTQKYRYFTVAVPRDSLVLERIAAEARESGVPEAAIILVRLLDYYRAGGSAKPSTEVTLTGLSVIQAPTQEQSIAIPGEVEQNSEMTTDNVLAFLDEL